jgi:hypothetical protein
MTMPNLMNCPHQGDGWCLSCVNDLRHERDVMARHRTELRAAMSGILAVANVRIDDPRKAVFDAGCRVMNDTAVIDLGSEE